MKLQTNSGRTFRLWKRSREGVPEVCLDMSAQAADLTPQEARQLGAELTRLADVAERDASLGWLEPFWGKTVIATANGGRVFGYLSRARGGIVVAPEGALIARAENIQSIGVVDLVEKPT